METGWYPLRSSPPARPCEGSVPAPTAARAPLIATGLTAISMRPSNSQSPAICRPWFRTLRRFELSGGLLGGFVTVYNLSFIFSELSPSKKEGTKNTKKGGLTNNSPLLAFGHGNITRVGVTSVFHSDCCRSD